MSTVMSRRSFAVSAGVAAGVTAIAGATTAAGIATAEEAAAPLAFKPGTYTGTGRGRTWDVVVKATFSDNAIESVDIVKNEESPSIAASAFKRIPADIVAGQTLNIDLVSGATLTSNAILSAVEECVRKAGGDVEALRAAEKAPANGTLVAGTYTGAAHGHHSDIVVEVELGESDIKSVTVTSSDETYNLRTLALTELPDKIVAAQSIGVDVIAGATFTSRGVLGAVEDALEQAGGAEAIRAFAGRVHDEAWSEEEKTADFDVVIVGSGIAGISAALNALDGGASVALIDKLPMWGGTSQYAAGYFRVPSGDDEEMREKFYNDYLDFRAGVIFDDEAIVNEQYPDRSITRMYTENVKNALEVLASHGAELEEMGPFVPVNQPNYSSNFFHFVSSEGYVPPNVNAWNFENMLADFTAKGGKIILNCSAESLITDDAGAVVGLRASAKDGKYTFNAKKVILSSGGFGYNPALINEFAPWCADSPFVTSAQNYGDGLVMARDLGAAVYDDCFLISNGGQTYMRDWEMAHPYRDGVVPRCCMFVDGQGLRVNSENPIRYTTSAMYHNPDGRNFHWVIINEKNATDTQDYAMGLFEEDPDYSCDLSFIDVLEQELEAGNDRYFKAETLAALATKIKVEPNILRYTLRRYNRFAANGEDTDFHTEPQYMVPMPEEEGPWYAVKVYLTYWGCVGGLVLDPDMHVLDGSGEPIPNLFACGEVANHGVFNIAYLDAGSLGWGVCSGYRAGTVAVQEL